MRQFNAKYLPAAAVGLLICGAFGSVLVFGQSEHTSSGLFPLGISPQDATRIVDPEKQQLWLEQYSIEATAKAATPVDKNPTPYTPPDETEMSWQIGIFPDANPRGHFIFSNVWHGYFGGERISVYAGLDTRGTARGSFSCAIMTSRITIRSGRQTGQDGCA
jgi:hypothetical protein